MQVETDPYGIPFQDSATGPLLTEPPREVPLERVAHPGWLPDQPVAKIFPEVEMLKQQDVPLLQGKDSLGLVADAGNANTLAAVLIVAAAGAVVGYFYGGGFGAIAGGLYGGAAVNAVRAATNATKGTIDSDHEAIVSGTYALIGAGVATYIAYKTYQGTTTKEEASDKSLVAVK